MLKRSNCWPSSLFLISNFPTFDYINMKYFVSALFKKYTSDIPKYIKYIFLSFSDIFVKVFDNSNLKLEIMFG